MSSDEMRVRPQDYDVTGSGYPILIDEPECDFCDDRGCEDCHPDDFAQMHLKWTCDGTTTLDEAIEALEEFIKDVREYQANGFELCEPVDNSHFYLERSKASDSDLLV